MLQAIKQMPEVAAGLAAALFTVLGMLAALFGLVGSKPTIVSSSAARVYITYTWPWRCLQGGELMNKVKTKATTTPIAKPEKKGPVAAKEDAPVAPAIAGLAADDKAEGVKKRTTRSSKE